MDDGTPQADSGAESQASAGGDLESLQALIAEKDKEIAELKDKYLRTLAESENARKRIRQQADESVRIQRESILRDLLPIIDNLERALAAAREGTDAKTIVDGVEMTAKALLDFLRAHGCDYAQGRLFGDAMEADKMLAILASQESGPAHHGALCAPTVLRPMRLSS